MTFAPRYAVFGLPIAHSLSPRIHGMFAAELGIALDYRAIEAGPTDFADRLAAFAARGGRGANVTLPLKSDAAALCTQLGAPAQRCGSVNTLTRVGSGWRGDSTDGIGLLRDLAERHAFEPRGRRILLLGAGGAARAAAFAFAAADTADLVIANRTPQRASALARELGSGTHACAWSRLAAEGDFDLVVNATSAGHGGRRLDLPQRVPGSHALCYDLSYAAAASPFLDWARSAGAQRVSDGLGMLVEQAAESFTIWHGSRPHTGPVLTALRTQSAARTDQPT